METLEIIKLFGFTDKEAAVYLALLTLGASSAYTIALKSGLKRPTVYVILDELVKQGAVAEVPRSGKKLYRAVSPESLLKKSQDQIKKLQDSIPILKAIEKTEHKKPTVLFFEGIEGMKEVLNYKLDNIEQKEIVAFAATSDKETLRLFNNFDDYNDRLFSLGINIRAIVPEEPFLQQFRDKDRKYNREMTQVSLDEFDSRVAIELTDSWVKIYDLYNLQGLIIENAFAAKTLKQIFEMLWKRIKKGK